MTRRYGKAPETSGPSQRLRFEDEDAPEGNGTTSGQHGPKPKGGKFRQDDDQPRPSDRMRQEDAPGGGEPSGREPEDRTDRRQKEKNSDAKSEKFQKAQEKADRAGEKLHTARDKLDKAQAKQAAKKPPGLARKAVRGARTEAWFYVHNKIHQVEQENVGVEGAHKSELVAEGAARRLTRYAKRRYREHPARRVAKWERKEMSARADLDFQKMAAEHPELASSHFSPDTAEMETETEVCQRSQSGGKAERKRPQRKRAASTGSAAKRAGQFAARHPAGVLLLLLLFLVFAVVASATSLFTTVGGGLSNAVSGTSYASEDDDLLGADEDYSAMERELSQTVANIERDHRAMTNTATLWTRSATTPMSWPPTCRQSTTFTPGNRCRRSCGRF